jgi:DNA primase catalytic subunit
MNKVNFLNYLFYDFGKQQYNFYLQYSEKDGIKTKWRKFLDVFSDPENKKNKWFIENCNQRQILPIEVVLDLESMEELDPALEKLKKFNLQYYVFSTGSRGVHIHIFFNKELTGEEKLAILKYFDADLQKAGKKTLIALEYSKHWKSGKLKEEVKVNG